VAEDAPLGAVTRRRLVAMRRALIERLDEAEPGDVGGLVSTLAEIHLAILAIDAAARGAPIARNGDQCRSQKRSFWYSHRDAGFARQRASWRFSPAVVEMPDVRPPKGISMPCPNCGAPVTGPGPFCGPLCRREAIVLGVTWQRVEWPAGIRFEDAPAAARAEGRWGALPPPAMHRIGTAAEQAADLGATEE